MVDLLHAIFVCWLVVKFLSLEEIRESNPGHFDTSRDTWEVAGWKSDRPTGFDGVVWARGRTATKICVENVGWRSFYPLLAGFLEPRVVQFRRYTYRYENDLVAVRREYFPRIAKAAAGYRMLQQLCEIVNKWKCLDYYRISCCSLLSPRNFGLYAMINREY